MPTSPLHKLPLHCLELLDIPTWLPGAQSRSFVLQCRPALLKAWIFSVLQKLPLALGCSRVLAWEEDLPPVAANQREGLRLRSMGKQLCTSISAVCQRSDGFLPVRRSLRRFGVIYNSVLFTQECRRDIGVFTAPPEFQILNLFRGYFIPRLFSSHFR